MGSKVRVLGGIPSVLNLIYAARQLGLDLEGDSSNSYWGAFDAIVKTNVRATAALSENVSIDSCVYSCPLSG